MPSVERVTSSFGLLLQLVFPESSGEGGRPHVQRGPGRESQEEEEGHLETEPVDHTPGQSAKRQLPQHLQRGQETVVRRLDALLSPLSAVHHGSEGESSDETAQEVLNAHAEDSHTFHEGRGLQHSEQRALEDHADGPQHKHAPHHSPDAELSEQHSSQRRATDGEAHGDDAVPEAQLPGRHVMVQQEEREHGHCTLLTKFVC